jgi:monovalent cation:H+ antiporter-2, CPA2 family
LPNALVALGGAFLAAGLLARLGRRIGLPTIPFFMAAGILTGPNTPGLVLIENPADLEIIAAIGLIMLLFHLGLEFSLDDLTSGGPRLLAVGAHTSCSTSAAAWCSGRYWAGGHARRS